MTEVWQQPSVFGSTVNGMIFLIISQTDNSNTGEIIVMIHLTVNKKIEWNKPFSGTCSLWLNDSIASESNAHCNIHKMCPKYFFWEKTLCVCALLQMVLSWYFILTLGYVNQSNCHDMHSSVCWITRQCFFQCFLQHYHQSSLSHDWNTCGS